MALLSPGGPAKRRRIGARTVGAVVEAAGEGQLGRSGAKVWQSLQKLRAGLERQTGANRCGLLCAARYWLAARRTHRGLPAAVLSVAWGATRVG